MNDGSPGVVERARRAQPAATPDPVGDGAIDEEQPGRHEDQEGRVLHPVGQSAGDQSRGDDREGHLEHHVDGLRDRRGQRTDRVQSHRRQHDVLEVTDVFPGPGKGDRVADDHPENGDDARRAETLGEGGQNVLLAHHAGVKERQTRNGHHQHQDRGGEHPGGVAGVDLRRRRGGGAGRPQRAAAVAVFVAAAVELCRRCNVLGERSERRPRDHDGQGEPGQSLKYLCFHRHCPLVAVVIKAPPNRFRRCGCERRPRHRGRRSCRRRSCRWRRPP